MYVYIYTYIHIFFSLQNIEEAEQRSLLHRPQDLLFIIYLIPAFGFCVFRGLVRTTATQNIMFIPPRLLFYSNSLVYRLFWTAPASGPRTICTIMSRTWKTHRPILGCRYICLLLPHSASLNKPLMQTHLLVRCWWACCIQHRTTLLHFMDWWCRDVNGCQTWLLCTQEHWHRYVCTDQKGSVNNQINEACHDDTSMFCDQKWACGQVSKTLFSGLTVAFELCSTVETDGARIGAVYIIYLHPKMESLWSGGSQPSAPINSQQYKATIVFEPQAGVSFIGDIRADADFRPEGMVVLLAISCSLDYK